MATVSLQTVFDSARRALETGAADKAIGIAQHILVHFPRMVEGHRLLGEAYLNANEPEQAVAAFEQVLQADPENVAAYYGLGLAQQSLDQRPAAINAFERALEIQPNLADLRTQLMRLYSETPGSAGQFRLSRAGLGRLYARGGMFGQAIDEFRAVLDADAERDDVSVALAEALWRDGQEDEATDFCRDVLDRRPELLKPGVLLGYMLFAGGQPEGEALWRRAAEQDSSMAMARALFDILPPIRLEEPVLPEFDEAEWRAQEARRAAQPPLQPSVAAVAADEDFFADSWLSSAGSATIPSSARSYEEPVAPAPSYAAADDDDDLLASLLGFADTPPSSAAPTSDADFGVVTPFGLDDWGIESDTSRQVEQTLPSSLDQLGLTDPTPAQQNDAPDSVKPFSFDDWSFDDDAPAAPSVAEPAARQQSTNEFDLGNIEAFSFDDDTGSDDPFSFESAAADAGAVKPFSLDDDLDGLGVAPFALDASDDQPVASKATPKADLGNVQPFSLEQWGLDDNEPLPADAPQSTRDAGLDDLGDFKPFSLDELSLDSLEADPSSTLSGPQVGDDVELGDDAPGFSWEEPSWRTQRSGQQTSETQEGDSIFAKLMRSRPQEPPSTPPVESSPASQQDDEPDFFSIDEEPLRLDLDTDDQAGPSIAPADPQLFTPTQPSAGPDVPETADAAFDQMLTPSFDEPDQLFSWEQPTSAEPAEQLGTNLPAEPEPAAFSLSDLGFSDDELAVLDFQPEAAPQPTPAENSDEEVDLTPFSLADLGLSDDELAALDLQDDQLAPVDLDADEQASAPTAEIESAAPPAMPQPATSDDEVDLTPFSLADLGLSDDELALLSPQEDQPATTVQDQSESESAAPMAEAAQWFDLTDADDTTARSDEPAASTEEAAQWFDLADADDTTARSDEAAASTEDTLAADFGTEPSDAQAEFPSAVQPYDSDEQPTPFSLADLGLSDDELALFEQIQSEQQVDLAEPATPDAEVAPADERAETTSASEFAWPFDEADAATQPTQPNDVIAEPAFSWPSLDDSASESSFGETDQPGFADPQLDLPPADAASSDVTAESDFIWPFDDDVAAEDSATPTESTSVPSDLALAETPQLNDLPVADKRSGSVQPAESSPAAHEQTPLPSQLPEGAQSVAATADAQPAVTASPQPASQVGHGLSEILAQLAANPENHAMRLAVARMSLHTNTFDPAVEQYKQLIKRGELLDDVVDDLRDLIGETEEPQLLRRLHRLLGDAYMKQNRFREAMDEYSWTLARRG